MHPHNAPTVAKICRRVKEEIGCQIWLWTGYYIEDLNEEQMDALRDVDYVIDGPFIEELADPYRLKWRGSSNQRFFTKAPLGFFVDDTEKFS